jgi:alpha-amylase/alpha-mannosidase (GH57 family)
MHRPALIIHGHFYQPPRENPWTGIVEREPSAAPFHDWNERIYRECYRANGWARIMDEAGTVADIVNNYERLSFNFGPTLLSWMARHHDETYRRLLAADKASLRARGHGNAIAQGYNHAILPLCNERDRRTQIRWGLAEFAHRFGRAAEALWLPETACDDLTLGALVDEGLRYAILAPGQAARVKIDGAWVDVADGSIDPRRPYRWLHPDGSGRAIALFFYDGAISRAVAFESGLSSSRDLIDRFERASGGEGTVVHAVTDGESYGHHAKFGDRCLAYALSREAEARGFWITNYAELLDHHPPTSEVEIKAGEDGKGTAWSCAHGVGRWYRDCGCHTGGGPGWNQKWRTPLRAALDGLRDVAAAAFEARMGELAADPWAVRDAYIELVLERDGDRAAFFERVAGRRLGAAEQVTAMRLCEMQRSAMLMYTSCGWFFNDVSGIETLQILRYAGRLCDQLVELGLDDPEPSFLGELAESKSNLASHGSGADLYAREVRPSRVRAEGLAAHVAIMSLPSDTPTLGEIAGFAYELDGPRRERRGRIALSTARLALVELSTGARHRFGTCALHFGGVEMHCVLRRMADDVAWERAEPRIWEAFAGGSLLNLLRVAEEELGPDDFGLHDVLPSGREALSDLLFADMRERYVAQYEAMYQDARQTISQFHEAGLPLPDELRTAAGLALAYRFDEEIAAASPVLFEPAAYRRAREIAEEASRYGCKLRTRAARAHFEGLLGKVMHRVAAGATDQAYAGRSPIDAALGILRLAHALGIELPTERAQELLARALGSGLSPSDRLRDLAAALGLSQSLYS